MPSDAESRSAARLAHAPLLSALRTPFPDFEACHRCGADAGLYVYWGGTDGWCCVACGGSDADE